MEGWGLYKQVSSLGGYFYEGNKSFLCDTKHTMSLSVDSAKNKSNNTRAYININKKREIKSKMCNRIKKCKTNKTWKTVYWD